MKKRIISFLLILVMAFCVLPSANYIAQASDYATELRNKGFPENYISKLVALHDKYPQWNFEPLNTGLDFKTAVDKERTPHSQQLIEKVSFNEGKNYYCNCSSCYKNGNYVPQEGKSWISASRKAVEHYMDPLNFLDEKYIFQFESTNYSNQQTIEGIETIISNTWMKNAYITYKDAQGKTVTYSPKTKYSEAIMAAAKNSGMSAYYLASKIVQEVGGAKPTAGGASGTFKGYEGIYNYYNIGANTGVKDGLVWASSSASGYVTNCTCRMRQKPTTNSTILTELPTGTPVTYISATSKQADGYVWYNVSAKRNGKTYTGYIRSDLIDYKQRDKYNRPWTNPYLSIYNGATFIANGFSKTQYTGYLQKFNVNPASGSDMHGHEYMANVQAAASEGLSTYKAYSNAGLLKEAKTFVIPVYTDSSSNNTPGWHTIDGKTYYYNEEGKKVISWQLINNTWYFFDHSGVMQTGWLSHGNKWYYLDSSGKMKTGWQTINGKKYYFNGSGAMLSGWQTIDNKKYYFNNSGAMIIGWQNINNIWYWFDSQGVMKQNGFQTIKGKTYYFNDKGEMLVDWNVIDNSWYYFDDSGAMVTGWLKQGNSKYWLNSDGKMAIGFKTISNKKYYFNKSGKMITNWQLIDNNWYWFNGDGSMLTGWKVINHKWYFFNGQGKMLTGLQKINGKNYYFTENGDMITGWKVINNTWYFFDNSGAMVTGWLHQGNSWYWLENDGKMAIGFRTINNKKYYFNKSGKMITNWQLIDNNWYWFNGDGSMLTGWKVINHKWYFFNGQGKMLTGWHTISGSTYYFYSNGDMAEGKQKIDGVMYDFGQDGRCRNPKK